MTRRSLFALVAAAFVKPKPKATGEVFFLNTKDWKIIPRPDLDVYNRDLTGQIVWASDIVVENSRSAFKLTGFTG